MPPFVPRQRKHKVRARDSAANGQANTNQVQLPPQNKSEKEERRRLLKEELRAGQPKISAKKKKRLDKYIEKKLKKDENLELLKSLSQARINTTHLQSSRHLGKRKHSEFVIDGLQHERARNSRPPHNEDVDSAVESEDSFEEANPRAFSDPGSSISFNSRKPIAIMPSSGSGLKHPLEFGEDNLPIMPLRKRRKPRSKSTEEIPWGGFETESSAEDAGTDKSESEKESDSSIGNDSGFSVEDGSSEGEASETPNGSEQSLKLRNSVFKAWAKQQINESLGYTPSSVAENFVSSLQSQVSAKTQAPSPEPPPSEPQISQSQMNQPPAINRKVYSVKLNRPAEMQEARSNLPVVAEEQNIMEAIHNNPVVIIWGATGSGKTTQVPQFLLEAGYGDPGSPTPGLIGVTQPRRIAAVSMAKRVADELGQHGKLVSYQIRFENTASNQTAIKFMTDGILLREISQDFALRKYSAIVIDEAHERSVNTDILIGMLSRIVDLRARMNTENSSFNPLKLIIMSATLRISDFLQNANLFRSGPPPLVEAEGRQFPVTVHFAHETKGDYVDETFKKLSKAHRKLPPGGMLVFLTSQSEIKTLLTRLQKALNSTTHSSTRTARVQIAARETPLETEDLELGGFDDDDNHSDDSEVEILTQYDEPAEAEEEFAIGEEPGPLTSAHILPLYSQLSTKEQLRVFEHPPENSRLIVLATNVAETSVTIPGIRYVFDCGRSKERQYDQSTGVQSFEISWISKASAEQRAGRAGRTGPGHCYRLYSSAVYERDFVQHADPEILRTPIESVVLQMKSMGLEKVTKFPFPTPPDVHALAKAERLLKNLGALTSAGQVTELGQCLSLYPLSPRFGKMLVIGSQHGCLPYVIAMVAGLAVADLFIAENQIDMTPLGRQEDQVYTQDDHEQDAMREERREDYNKARALFSRYDRTSDALKLLTAVCAYGYAEDPEEFSDKMFLRSKGLKEVTQLRKQLTDLVRANYPTLIDSFQARLPEASPKQLKALNQLVTAGFIDQVAIRSDLASDCPEVRRRPKRAIDVPYLPLFPLNRKGIEMEEKAVYLHPSSIIARLAPKDLPQYLVYSHLQQAAPSYVASEKVAKVRMFPLTATGGTQLSMLAHDSPLISYGKPIGQITQLGGLLEKRECWVVPSMIGEAGSVGWPLPAKKVIQKKDPTAGWVIEKFLS